MVFAMVLLTIIISNAEAWAQSTLRMDRPEPQARVAWPLEVSGQAPPHSRVKLSLDGELKATLRVGEEGKFVHKITGLPPKKDTIRVTAAVLDARDQTRQQATVDVSLGQGQPMKSAAPGPSSQVAAYDKIQLTPSQLRDHKLLSRPVKLAAGLFREPTLRTPALRYTPAELALDQEARPKPGLVPKLMSQGLFSVLIGGAGATAGGLVAWKVAEHQLGDSSPVEPIAIAAGAYLGGALLLPLGVYTGGEAAQGNGSLFWTYAIGLASTGGAIYYARKPWVGTKEAVGTLLIFPVLGSWLGYEFSSHVEGTRAKLSLMPSAQGAQATLGMSW